MGRFISALPFTELPPGKMVGVTIEGMRILLTNLEGTIHAVSGTCTHEDTDLSSGFMIEDNVTCPLHLSQFNLRTGEVLNPPATEPLRRFNVKIEGDYIYVEV